MYYVSDTFNTAIAAPHTACAKLEVWSARTLIFTTEMTTSSIPVASLLSGNVTINRTSDVRRNLSASVFCTDPNAYRTYFDPLLGYDIVVSRGIKYSSGTREWCPLGVFKIDSANVESRSGGMSIDLNGFDRARMIAKNVWSAPFSIASGTEYTAAIQAIINSRASGFTPEYNMVTSASTIPALFFSEKDDPWKASQKLAQAIGYDLYFDNNGALVSTPLTDPTTAPVVLDLTAGTTAVRIGNLKRSVNIGDNYNGVIVRGSAPWLLFPVYGEAWDDDPTSPTWRGGPFGSRPKVMEDAMVTSNGQATSAATAELYKVLGRTEQINFNILPDPRIDAGDVVRIYDSNIDTYGRYTIESLQIPLIGGTVSGTVRQYTRSIPS